MNRKAQFILQNLGENTAGYRAGNRVFPQIRTSRTVHICLHWLLYTPDNVLLCKPMLVQYQLFITFILWYCL